MIEVLLKILVHFLDVTRVNALCVGGVIRARECLKIFFERQNKLVRKFVLLVVELNAVIAEAIRAEVSLLGDRLVRFDKFADFAEFKRLGGVLITVYSLHNGVVVD